MWSSSKELRCFQTGKLKRGKGAEHAKNIAGAFVTEYMCMEKPDFKVEFGQVRDPDSFVRDTIMQT